MTTEELIAFFAAKATPPPPQSSLILARHLECKESLELARILAEAMGRHAASDSQQLAAPADLLPPLV